MNKKNKSTTNCVVIKIMEVIKILIITIMSITVKIIIIIYKILWKWCKVGNREMLYDTCK